MNYIIALSWLVCSVIWFFKISVDFGSNFVFNLLDFFSTPPRVYRQVASLMGLQLVTSFINVAKVLGAQRETTQRQLNAEKKKRSEGPRVESLDKRLSVTHENITMIEEMMRRIFTG